MSALLHGPPNERKDTDANSFIETYGTLSFFREYIQEGHKGLVRAAFMKGELKSYQKGEFITIKGYFHLFCYFCSFSTFITQKIERKNDDFFGEIIDYFRRQKPVYEGDS